MKLHSPRFERSLRGAVRRTVRRSAALRREARAGVLRRNYNIWPTFRVLLPLLLAGLVFLVMNRTQHPVSGLAVITVWTFAFIFIHAHSFMSASSDVPVLALLPISNERMFRWELQKSVRRSVMSLVDLTAGFIALGVLTDFTAAQWLALAPILAATWLMMLALAGLCLMYIPWLVQLTQLAGFGLLLLFIFSNRLFPKDWLLTTFDRLAGGINLFLPTGWAASLFNLLLPQRDWWLLALLVPVVSVIFTLKLFLDRWRKNFDLHEIFLDGPPSLIPIDEEAREIGSTGMAEVVRSRQFLERTDWQQLGYCESALWRWFTDREKTLAEFAFPDGLVIGDAWKKIGRNLLIACLAAGVLALFLPGIKGWILCAALFIPVSQALARVLDSGRAFSPIPSSGVSIPMYAAFAIGYCELARLLFKTTLIQLPLFALFVLTGSAVVAYGMNLPILLSLAFGLKLSVLVLAARFILVTFAFSGGTNDTTGLRSVMVLVVIVFFNVLCVAASGGFLYTRSLPIAVTCGTLALLSAYGFFRAYGWFYHRNRFDLMSVPRAQ